MSANGRTATDLSMEPPEASGALGLSLIIRHDCHATRAVTSTARSRLATMRRVRRDVAATCDGSPGLTGMPRSAGAGVFTTEVPRSVAIRSTKARAGIGGRVYTHRNNEGPIARHHVGTMVGEPPFEAEVALPARGGVRGDDRHEQRAIADLLADLLVPHITAAKLALIEPYLDTRAPQRLTNTPRRIRILRCVAEEDGP